MEWDHLRTFEAVARLGSFTETARALAVSQSTVSRHVARLEEIAGSPLLQRTAPLLLTERGASLLAALQPMVGAALAARVALENAAEVRGWVTVATVGEVARWVIAPALPALYAAHPRLRLRILAGNQTLSLAAGAADIALRLTKPRRGELVARRLHRETYGFFVAPGLALEDDVPWLSLAGALAHIPEQQFAERAFAGRSPRLMVDDVETLGLAVRDGLGVAILPRTLARRIGGLSEVSPLQIGARDDLGAIPERVLWMVVHRSKRDLPKVKATSAWLTQLFA